MTHAEKEVVTLRAGEKAYGPFVYGGRYFEECSDMEFTAPVIYGVIGAFVVVSIIAAVAIFLTFRYKRQYYELLGDKDETELKDIDKGPDMAPPPDNKLEVH